MIISHNLAYAIILISIITYFLGCGHHDHLRDTLQKDHPDCYVTDELEIKCPNQIVR